jgi:hypothetical protein
MARIKTGVGQKANRQNLKALEICYTWANQFGATNKMSADLAWVVSDGKFGTEPVMTSTMPLRFTQTDATVDTFKVALHIVKRDKLVQ